MTLGSMRLIGAALTALSIAIPAQAADKVKFNMSWLPQGSVGGIIVAKELGYFKDAGIEVDLSRGYGGLRTVNEIDQGMFEFGYGNPVGVVLNRSKGGATKMIGAINARWPAGLCYVEQRIKPKNIADIKGLRVAGGPGSPVQVVVPTWLEMNGFPRDHLKLVNTDPAVIDASLIEGMVDLAECWLASSWPKLRKLAEKANVTLGWIEYRKYGLDIYGSGLTTSDKLIEEKPDLVRRFVQATYRGYEFLQKNPQQSAELIVKSFPILTVDLVLEEINEINDLIIDPAVKDKGLGWQRDDRMAKTIAFIAKAYNVSESMKPADIYTNEFLK